MLRVLHLVLAALVAEAAANQVSGGDEPPCEKEENCPTCEHITNATVCLTGTHPTMPKSRTGAVHCAWNATLGNVTTPGCSNCTMAVGMEYAHAYCRRVCQGAGPDPVVMKGCCKKDPHCTTSGKNGGPSGEYQWRCYNPASVNANHTEWKPGTGGYCSRDVEIKGIINSCQCKGNPQCHFDFASLADE